MRLDELDPRCTRDGDNRGVSFLCPKCIAPEMTGIGVHRIGVDTVHDWSITGEGFTDMSIMPSIQVVGGCAWHGFITNGETV